MSFLTPLYIAGALAVSLPVLFHLIRRTPRGEQSFSSLMFLSPSPPRITRRSRIEHWLLLALRSLAVVLMAMAFARPFWRQPLEIVDADVGQRRIAILVDTSASMRREDLWQQAVAVVDDALAQAGPRDEVAVFACDETLRPIAGFEDLAQVPAPQRRGVVADRLAELEPTWAASRLGQALLDAVELVSDGRDTTKDAGRAGRSIILVSDMQSGSRIQELGDFPWPLDVPLELKRVAVKNPTNAGLWRLADERAADRVARGANRSSLRIRVSNAADSAAERFQLAWVDGEGTFEDRPVEAYVPPGESRVVRVAAPPLVMNAPRLVLRGDAHDFDDALYVVSQERRAVTVGYLGADAPNDPDGLQYYLERAIGANTDREAHLADFADLPPTSTPRDAPPLVVVAIEPGPADLKALSRYVTAGGHVLYILTNKAAGNGLAALLDSGDLAVEEAPVDDYAMLQEIDFSHPMFAPMAGAKFNDFTAIRFWRHRRIDDAVLGDARVVARFDDGDPAIIERRTGRGRVTAMTAGWHPRDSQLARSWKFVLMLAALIGDGDRDFRTEYVVNERVALPERGAMAETPTVTLPDGTVRQLAADAQAFTEATRPGLYVLAGAAEPVHFAVNVDPAESDTAPLAPEAFEQLGCRLTGGADAAAEADSMQQLRDIELEGRQRLWQWLLAAALCVLIVETWLAARTSQRLPTLNPT